MQNKPKSFKDLIIWQKSFKIAKDTYILCSKLPKHETSGLVSQMQRSAVSIPSNIAEGQQRNGVNEFKQFNGIARGSAAELETQLLLVASVYNIDTVGLVNDLLEVQKMLTSLKNSI